MCLGIYKNYKKKLVFDNKTIPSWFFSLNKLLDTYAFQVKTILLLNIHAVNSKLRDWRTGNKFSELFTKKEKIIATKFSNYI